MKRVLLVLFGTGCAASGGGPQGQPGGTSAEGGQAASQPSGGTDAGGSDLVTAGGAPPVVNPSVTRVFAHSADRLFELDPGTLALSDLGAFDCVTDGSSSLTDLAANAEGDLWGVTASSVMRLSVETDGVTCLDVTGLNADDNNRFYGLTYAPKGVIDDTKEVLVAGNTAGNLWAIDESGSITELGTLGKVPATDGHGYTYPSDHKDKRWVLSGDIVFLSNGNSPVGYATVRDCPNPPGTSNCGGDEESDPLAASDTLIELDLSKLKSPNPSQSLLKSVRGRLRPGTSCGSASPEAFTRTFGLAAWDDRLYGFAKSGAVLQIAADGSGCPLTAAGSGWAGAAVTTSAPIDLPPE